MLSYGDAGRIANRLKRTTGAELRPHRTAKGEVSIRCYKVGLDDTAHVAVKIETDNPREAWHAARKAARDNAVTSVDLSDVE